MIEKYISYHEPGSQSPPNWVTEKDKKGKKAKEKMYNSANWK